MKSDNNKKPLRAAAFAEQQLLTNILKKVYPAGSYLPNERDLAKSIGVTRQTLRETLQRLAREGWITIRHGKSTIVNNYWETGGLGLLSTLTRYGKFLPNDFLFHITEARNVLLPDIAKLAVQNSPDIISEYLKKHSKLKDNADSFVKYDWGLQILMAKHSDNTIFSLMFNDFESIYAIITLKYFKLEKARELARNYYKDFFNAIKTGAEEVEKLVRNKMKKAGEIWKELTGEPPSSL